MTAQALERLGRLERWFRDYATSFATRLYASDFRERAEELASIRQSLGGGEAYAYMMPPDKVILAAHWTGTLPPFGWMPLYTHPKPAQVDAPKPCTWSQEDWESDCWGTSCGHAFSINDGTPSENRMKHCCYCGGELSEEPFVDPHEDDEDDEDTPALQPEPRGTQQDSAPGATPTTNPPAQPSAKGE